MSQEIFHRSFGILSPSFFLFFLGFGSSSLRRGFGFASERGIKAENAHSVYSVFFSTYRFISMSVSILLLLRLTMKSLIWFFSLWELSCFLSEDVPLFVPERN